MNLLTLQIQIVRTLATGELDYMADLLGVRLASINQILDPWLYILVRRSFIQKVIRSCKNTLCVELKKQGKPNRRTPMVRLYPPPNDLVANVNANGDIAVRIEINNDIMGLYQPCPHCESRRRREVSPNLALPENSGQRLPDVMGSNDSHHSELQSLPDVTPEGSLARPPERPPGGGEATSGYYDTDSEPIYVDVFLLPRRRFTNRSSLSTDVRSYVSDGDNELSSQPVDSVEEGSVFIDGTSTSGVFSWQSQHPRRPYKSVDVTVYNNRKTPQQQQRR